MVRQMYAEEYVSLETLRDIRRMTWHWYHHAAREGAYQHCREYLEGWAVVSGLIVAVR